ncbi:hypothetical protein LOTGIDRAFT_237224 [Lottia gigantea]|uniref:DUF4476 domain-containing protein n=1 Tax=Lottia gigantea TaxID=225164 RepID=V3ZHZ3_LOTGI|nr:hypothetical protein LOTGIDRAFT_237224 [Lottia gigantea]ESO81925.1 hypothetical protein LOTGIDRAFT_237224 [Lottia gigantea]
MIGKKNCLHVWTLIDLKAQISTETDSSRRKLEILFESNGTVCAAQAAEILKCIGCAPHKIQAIKILESRLESMTCKEAKEVIGAVSIHKDKIDILECIKRVLTDNETKLGEEYILSAFPYEHDKNQALNVLNTVRTDRSVKLAAGGHQGYAALGGLFTQARPLHPHLYGPIEIQARMMEDKSKGLIPARARSDYMNSTYATSHPPMPYIRDKTYQEERGYPGSSGYPANINNSSHNYPSGAPPLHMSGGSPAPTGYYTLERSAYVQNYS